MILETGEQIEDLQCNNLQIIQNKNLYNFTSDSVILANFVKTKSKDTVVEIGAGSGVVSILLQTKQKQNKIYAFEIQPEMQVLCKKNIELNKLDDKIALVCDDVKNFEKYLKAGSVDVVFSNPPYFKETNFKQNVIKKIAKEEVCLSAQDLVKTASKMLKNGGNFYFCYCADRSVEMIELCHKNKLEIKEMFYTENGKGDVKLFVARATKGANSGVKVYKNLITNEENGDYIESLHTKYIIK